MNCTRFVVSVQRNLGGFEATVSPANVSRDPIDLVTKIDVDE